MDQLAANLMHFGRVLRTAGLPVGTDRLLLAAQALQAIAGEQFGFDPDKGRDDNRAAVRRAELWYLKNR